MMLDLERCVVELEAWDGSLLVVRGAAGHFCAGADLRLVHGPLSSPSRGVGMCDWMTDLLNRIYLAPFVSVAVIEGAAMGGGAEFAIATDFRLMADSARFQFVQARRGLSPGWGGAARLVQIVGRTKALGLLAPAAAIDPQSAMACGLVDHVFDQGEAEIALSTFVAPILEHNSSAVRANKKAVVAACAEGLGSSGEKAAFAAVWPPTQTSSP